MSTRIDFIYLSEPDMIEAGVLDAERCVTVCEETFSLLGKGDYLMGGANHNNHGMNIVFPMETKFPNMPVAGPDRRFAAMPGYLGGRFDVCGNKWYGSNHANTQKGLPRSILTMMINDKDTGAPLALLSANLLSAARTGAVPGVAAKHLANKDSKVVSIVGCGPINKSCFTAIMTQLSSVEKVICFDVFLDKANELARWVEQTYKIKAVGVDEAEAGFRDADVITVAASRLKPLFFKDEWIKEGATILVSGPVNADESFLTSCKEVPPGTWGEIVFSVLRPTHAPLLRYRTGDVGRQLSPNKNLETAPSYEIRGRFSDQHIVRGKSVFPVDFEEIIYSHEEIGNEYLFLIEQDGSLRLILEQSFGSTTGPGACERLISDHVNAVLGLNVAVEVKPFGAIADKLGIPQKKSGRFTDLRGLSPAGRLKELNVNAVNAEQLRTGAGLALSI